MKPIFYILIFLLALPFLYTMARIISKAVFRSYFIERRKAAFRNYFTERRKEKRNENEVR